MSRWELHRYRLSQAACMSEEKYCTYQASRLPLWLCSSPLPSCRFDEPAPCLPLSETTTEKGPAALPWQAKACLACVQRACPRTSRPRLRLPTRPPPPPRSTATFRAATRAGLSVASSRDSSPPPPLGQALALRRPSSRDRDPSVRAAASLPARPCRPNRRHRPLLQSSAASPCPSRAQ